MRANSTRLAGIFTLALLTGGITVMHTASAHAQGTKAAVDKDGAKKAYGEGNKFYKAGDFAAALPKFRKADSLYPGAAPKHKIAVCLDKLGRYQEALAAYQTFIDSNPGAKYTDRVTNSKARMAEMKATLPGTVVVTLTPADLANVTYEVDGARAEGPSFKLKPGPHTLVVKADGHEPLTREVTVTGASQQDVALTLTPIAVVQPPAPAPTPMPEEPVADDGGGSDNIPAYVTLGIAGVGAVVGTIFGVQALSAKSDFDDNPTQENADTAERNALISDMSFGVALTFGITGAVLLFTGDDSDEEAPSDAASARPVIVPYAGLKGGGIQATWSF